MNERPHGVSSLCLTLRTSSSEEATLPPPVLGTGVLPPRRCSCSAAPGSAALFLARSRSAAAKVDLELGLVAAWGEGAGGTDWGRTAPPSANNTQLNSDMTQSSWRGGQYMQASADYGPIWQGGDTRRSVAV